MPRGQGRQRREQGLLPPIPASSTGPDRGVLVGQQGGPGACVSVSM